MDIILRSIFHGNYIIVALIVINFIWLRMNLVSFTLINIYFVSFQLFSRNRPHSRNTGIDRIFSCAFDIGPLLS